MSHLNFFGKVGFFICIIGGLLLLYEAVSLVTPLPTLSRMVQGLRDGGNRRAVFLISLSVVWLFATIGAWLYYHFNYEPRSPI